MDKNYDKYLTQLQQAYQDSVIDEDTYQAAINALEHDTHVAQASGEGTAIIDLADYSSPIPTSSPRPNKGNLNISGKVKIKGDVLATNKANIDGDIEILGNIIVGIDADQPSIEGEQMTAQLNTPQERKRLVQGAYNTDTVKIKSGVADLIASGIAIAFENSPVEISFGREPITLVFVFSEQEGEENLPPNARILNDTTIELTSLKPKHPLIPVGTIKPLPLGIYQNRRLYVHYRVYNFPDGDSTLNYNIYLGEGVDEL